MVQGMIKGARGSGAVELERERKDRFYFCCSQSTAGSRGGNCRTSLRKGALLEKASMSIGSDHAMFLRMLARAVRDSLEHYKRTM